MQGSGRFLDGVGLVSECSAVNAVGVGDGELLHFRGGGGVGDADVNGSFGAAENPLVLNCIPVPCWQSLLQPDRPSDSVYPTHRQIHNVIGIQILVCIEGHDANPQDRYT